MSEVRIVGRGLACALGDSLAVSIARLAEGNPAAPSFIRLGQQDWPCFHIDAPPDPADAWLVRARQLIERVVAEADEEALANGSEILRRDGALFVASSSATIGALERGTPPSHDAMLDIETIAGWLDWRGPIFWVSTACTSAIGALLAARSLILSEACDHALVLGLELANSYTPHGFAAMQLLSADKARPLGAGRDGLVLGEAVAALHVTRGARGWRLGDGRNIVDGADAAAASTAAIVRSWQESLAGQGDVDVIKLQAAGSPGNDAAEAAAISRVFNATPALLSFKHLLGHTLGASGAAEIALLTACLEQRITLPVPHSPDPALPHGLSPALPVRCDTALTSIIGFGGSHAAIVLQREADDRRDEPTATPLHYRVVARSQAMPADWRDELINMLGEKPRRLGHWAELALWGALNCLQQAGLSQLPAAAIIRVSSLNGPRAATFKALEEIAREGFPMPFSFLQTQQGMLLASLARALHWQGDARVVTQRDPVWRTRLALAEAKDAPVLLGSVEEQTTTQSALSEYSLLCPEPAAPAQAWRICDASDLSACTHLQLTREGLFCA